MQDKYKWYLAASISVVVIGVCIIGIVSNSDNEEPSEKKVITQIRPNPPIDKNG